MTKASPKGRRSRLVLEGVHEDAMRETKEYAAGIREDPEKCPMFPVVNRSNGAAETICYMQGYLAGRLASAGKKPTKRQMEAIRDDVLHDEGVIDIVVGMQAPSVPNPDGPVPCDY